MDCSPPGSSVHETFHVKILEWVTISFSRVSSWPGDLTRVSSISYIVGKFFATEPTKTITWFLLQRLLCILVLPLPLWNSPSELPKRLQPGLKFLCIVYQIKHNSQPKKKNNICVHINILNISKELSKILRGWMQDVTDFKGKSQWHCWVLFWCLSWHATPYLLCWVW